MLCEEVSPSLSALVPPLYPRIDPLILSRGFVLEIPRRCTIPESNPGQSCITVLLRPIHSPHLPFESLRLSRMNLGNDFHRRISLRATVAARRAACLEFYFELLEKKKKGKKKKREKRRQQREKESRQRKVGKVLFRSLIGQVAAPTRLPEMRDVERTKELDRSWNRKRIPFSTEGSPIELKGLVIRRVKTLSTVN